MLNADEIEKGWKNLDKDHDGQVPPTLQNLLGTVYKNPSSKIDREWGPLSWRFDTYTGQRVRASDTDNKQRDNEFLSQSSSLSSRSVSSLFTIIYSSQCEENNSHMNIYNQ